MQKLLTNSAQIDFSEENDGYMSLHSSKLMVCLLWWPMFETKSLKNELQLTVILIESDGNAFGLSKMEIFCIHIFIHWARYGAER